MITPNTMAELEKLGFGADVDSLETYVAKLQDAAGMGKPLVDDALYDSHVRLLKQLKPDSSVLNRNWEIEDNDFNEYDDVLKKYGMSSITTVTDFDTGEFQRFKQVIRDLGHPVDLFASVKENGHGVRAVYLNGRLYTGSTRGRYKKGRDITRHLKAVLPNYVEAWKNIKLVEVRGEMLVKISDFENYLKPTGLKHPLSSVTSLIRDSVTDAELKYLNMVCYKVISSDGELELDTLSDEFGHLKECGFNIPQCTGVRGVTADNLEMAIDRILEVFEDLMDNDMLEYSCDGLVVSINNNNDFYSTGKNGNTWNGNIALKMGKYWEQNIYSSTIEEVVFIPGKSYMTPKALITPVVTGNGSEVRTVPLYNIGVMERYHYVPGETIYFRYGGETGVTCCDYLGNSVQV